MHLAWTRAVIGAFLATALLAPTFAVMLMPVLRGGGGGGGDIVPVEVEVSFPIAPGDGLVLRRIVTLSRVEGNGSVPVVDEVIRLKVVKPSWPFTYVEYLLGNSSRAGYLPTVMLAMPFMGQDVAAPISISLLADSSCVAFKYSDSTPDGVLYLSETPDAAKTLIVSALYREDGVARRLSIVYSIGGAVYAEVLHVVSASKSGGYNATVPVAELTVCNSYYSRELAYTLPGAYLFDVGKAQVLYSFEQVLKIRPLVLLDKRSDNQRLWELISTAYKGGAVVVSPLLRDFWSVPYVEEVQGHGAVLILPGGKKVVGAEKVAEEIAKLTLQRAPQ